MTQVLLKLVHWRPKISSSSAPCPGTAAPLPTYKSVCTLISQRQTDRPAATPSRVCQAIGHDGVSGLAGGWHGPCYQVARPDYCERSARYRVFRCPRNEWHEKNRGDHQALQAR